MLRNSTLALLVLLLLPAFANAWYVNAKTSPLTGQGTISPAGNLSYPTGVNSGEFTASPAPGYLLTRVTLDGANLAPNANGKYVVPYLAGKSWRYLVAYFALGSINITTQVTAGSGAIREDSNEPLSNIPLGSSRQLLVIPNPGYSIASLTAEGAVISDNGDGTRTASYSNLQSSKHVTASFDEIPALSVDAGGDLALYGAGPPYAATLYGSASGNQGAISYAWSGAGLSFGTPNAAVTTVYSDTPGSYTATLSASSGALTRQDSATVTVYNRAAYQSTICTSCHGLSAGELVALYQASRHSGRASCQDCHSDQPHTGTRPDSTPCAGCHLDPSGGFAAHPLDIGANPCLACHHPHSAAAFAGAPALHYNNVTSAGYPASYMSSRAKCIDCHYGSEQNAAVRQQWRDSAHAAVGSSSWRSYDFKTRSGCVQCHSTTGFLAYSTGRVSAAWGVESDKSKEVLSCIGCHSEVQSGALRSVTRSRPYPDDSHLNRDMAKSDLCVPCHSGSRNGQSITAQLALPADFGSLPFISPHYLAGAGVLQGKAGYHLGGPAGYAPYSSGSHRSIGMGNRKGTGSGGPCIACHKESGGGHGFAAQAGDLCAKCHGSGLPAEELELKRIAFANALEVLRAMLADRGLAYAPSEPHFANTDWGSGQSGADRMGAAFNYLLLLREPGAYAHNAPYTRKLILDSIDYLYNGAVTGSTESALAYLVARQGISQQQADDLAAYRDSAAGCTSCHGNSSGSHTAHLDSGFGCADCHSATASNSSTLVPGSGTHLNDNLDLVPGPGRSFSYSPAAGGGSCSAISCHNNGSATWGGTLGCDGCHGAPPATASHLKHYGGTVQQAAYGATAIAQDLNPSAGAYLMNCGNCHPQDQSRHGNGVLEVELYNAQAPAGSLKALNPDSASYLPGETMFQDDRGLVYSKGSCSNVYCHSYRSWTTPTGVPSYSTSCTPPVPANLVTTTHYRSVTWEGGALGCAGCHANPPQTSYPANGGGAGDSHAWLSDNFGWGSIEFLHKNNMYFETGNSEPLACLYCHNDTVRQQGSYTRVETASATYVNMSSVPIHNYSKHVNGRNDVAFERQQAVPTISYPYGSSWNGQKLSNASYDSATRTCSNVACHLLRTEVKWGTPYKGGVVNDCERCHEGYAGSCPDAAQARSRQPSISSTAPLLAAPGYLYSYQVVASEPGGGVIGYSLPTAPDGMTMTGSGLISWTPREDQLGTAAVKVLVVSLASDGVLIAEQEFSVTVQPPQVNIVSQPVTTTTAWKAYSYPVVGAAPSGLPALSYALTSFPSGMSISATTGTISWTPTESQVGSHPVTVTASSGAYQASQSFTIEVGPSPLAITSTPVTTASTQVLYSYQIGASLPGVSSFTYSLITKPTGMSINGSGLIGWTPTSTQAGSYQVTVQVSGGGYVNRQSFTVTVAASPITITSTPPTTAKVGTQYRYTVTATMPGGGTFTYALPVRPTTAMTVSSAGLITWTPSASFVGSKSVTVTVTRGASTASQSWVIVVSP